MIDKDMLYEKLLGGALLSIYAYADRSVSNDDFDDGDEYTDLLECAICAGLFKVIPKASFPARMSAAKFVNNALRGMPASTKDATETADKQAAYMGREFMDFIDSQLSIDNNGWFDKIPTDQANTQPTGQNNDQSKS